MTDTISHRPQKIILWLLLSLSLAFLMGRAHYFLPPLPRFYLYRYDASWHWAYQSQLEREMDGGTLNSFQKARDQFRTGNDHLIQKSVVLLARYLQVSRYQLNAVITAIIYLGAVGALFFLGLAILNQPFWALFFSLLVSQSVYFSWLAYPCVVPKMFGYALFPVVFLFLLRLGAKDRTPRIFFLVLLTALLIYPPGVVYYLPVVLPLGFLLLIFSGPEPARRRWRLSAEYCLGVLLLGGVLLLYHRPEALSQPPSLQVSGYFYPDLLLSWTQILKLDFWPQWGYFLLAGVSFWYLRRQKPGSTIPKALIAGYLGCFLLGLAAHLVAWRVPFSRVVWFWRVAYFSYVPGLLLIVMALQQYIATHNNFLRSPKAIGTLIPFLLIGVIQWTLTCRAIYTAPFACYLTIKKIQGKVTDSYRERFAGLEAFARKTPPGSQFLLPPASLQDHNMALLEAESGRGYLLSVMEIYLMIGWQRLTDPYYHYLKEYDRINALEDPRERSKELIGLARMLGADYVVAPSAKKRNLLGVPCVYRDSFWSVYEVP